MTSPFRLRIGLLVIAVVLSFYAARLVQLQAIDPGSYADRAEAEGLQEVVLPAERGDILDRNGRELATTMDGLMIVANPQVTAKKASGLASLLAAELGVDYVTTLEKLRKSKGEGRWYQVVDRRVPATRAHAVVAKARKAGFQGLSTERDPIRTYPTNDVAANLIGFIGEDEETGPLAGLERTFDGVLAGTDGRSRFQEVGGKRIPLGESATVDPRNGDDLKLTIDADTQFFAQRVLANTVRQYRAESGTAVVMDTRSGELIAYADYPSFDANDPQKTRKEYRGSKGASEPYEPGSVEKPLTLSAVIDEGEAEPTDRMTLPSEYPVKDRVVHDAWQHGTLKYTLAGVLAKSSNIGTVMAAQKISPTQLRGYLEKFGLGQRTNVGIRGESAGLLPEGWGDVSHATISFGQGVSVTALQMAAAINTIANGGVRVSPSLVDGRAKTDDGSVVGTATSRQERVISAETAKKLAGMMENVPDPDKGSAPAARIAGYRIAGKTGTAQVAGGGGYLRNVHTVSFAGFAPADNPRFTVYVVVKRVPGGTASGGGIAAPVFQKIMGFVLRKFAVPPTAPGHSPYATEWGD